VFVREDRGNPNAHRTLIESPSRFTYRGREHHRLDHVYLARTDHDAPQVALRHTANERAGLIERRWWSLTKLSQCAGGRTCWKPSSTADSRALPRHLSPDVVATGGERRRSGSTYGDPSPERLSWAAPTATLSLSVSTDSVLRLRPPTSPRRSLRTP
jgi:hypothetical protein